ncbi:MAG: hypothetical protein IJC25_01260 [Clostridia bacterium]|nr:hypothetical protein [Clostridia bacterium]
MKLIAVLLLAGVSLCAGALRSSALHARCTALESFLRLVTRCAGALQYLSPELIPLLRDLGDVGVLDPFVHRCLELCADRDFHTAWHGALPALPRQLTARDRSVIDEFGQGLGKSHLSAQLDHCSRFAELCREQLTAAKSDAAKLSPLYVYLGAAGGIAAAIVLL